MECRFRRCLPNGQGVLLLPPKADPIEPAGHEYQSGKYSRFRWLFLRIDSSYCCICATVELIPLVPVDPALRSNHPVPFFAGRHSYCQYPFPPFSSECAPGLFLKFEG